MVELLKGTDLDEEADDIFEWFQFRKVTDNTRFPIYFNREAKRYCCQYHNLLKNEMTEFDPIVSDYMERQTLESVTEATQRQATRRIVDSKAATMQGTTDGEGVGSSNVSTNGTTGSKTNSEANRESSSKTKGTTGTTASSKSDAASLQGDTPDSATYPAGGFPDALAWVYASGQGQTKGNTESKQDETTEGTGEDKGKETVIGSEEGETHATTEGSDNSRTHSESFRRDEEQGTSDVEDRGSDAKAGNRDNREQYRGRHEAAQDLLTRARTYIKDTNSFKWLIQRLDKCFMAVYDEEG